MAGNFDYDRKKKRYSRLLAGNEQFFCCGRKFSLRPEKKRYITTRKIKVQSSVLWVRGSGDYDRKKKIQSSVWRIVLLYQFLVLAGN